MRTAFCSILILLVAFFVNAYKILPDTTKSSWPELVGTQALYAESVVKKECDVCRVIVIGENSPMIRNLDVNRVWIITNKDSVVMRVPNRG